MAGRIKLGDTDAVYHCMSRVVGGQRLLDNHAKEVWRKMLWEVSEFCGIKVLAYCLMENHFHILVRVPKAVVAGRLEILRRYRLLYEDQAVGYFPRPYDLAAMFEADGEEAARWESRLKARMSDVSEFMKTLKQRFSVWYNRNHNRFGTFWAERFKSVLVEDCPRALRTVAAYIDLNPVRAGLVEDPADYRWCSYADALGAHRKAMQGIAEVVGKEQFREAAPEYRKLLFGKGGMARRDGQVVIPAEKVSAVLEAGGEIPIERLLRHRLRALSYGLALGSTGFLDKVRQHWNQLNLADGDPDSSNPQARRPGGSKMASIGFSDASGKESEFVKLSVLRKPRGPMVG